MMEENRDLSKKDKAKKVKQAKKSKKYDNDKAMSFTPAASFSISLNDDDNYNGS